MASFCLIPEFSIPKLFSALAWLALAVLPAYAQVSEQDTTTPLSPYTAEYKTTARGISLTLKRELKRQADGSYKLTNGGSALIVGFQETAIFRTRGAKIIPESYVYRGTGLMNRRREVQFTEGSDTLRSLYKEKWYELPYTDNTLDRMSQQEQVRLLLLNNPTPKEDIVITVADRKRVKDYRLAYVGEEVLETPLGTVNTLHFERIHKSAERKSDTWIAPAWGFMMVKTVHIEDGKPIEGIVTRLSIDGKIITSN